MATAKTVRLRTRQPSRWLRNLLLLVLVIAVAAAAFFWARMQAAAIARTAQAAQTGCICRFVSGRTMDACKADPGVAQKWVRVTGDDASRSVTGSVWALASQTSRWTPESGCMLDAWPQ